MYIIRFFDILFSLFGLFFLSPLFLLIFIINLISIRSPFFLQKRIGQYEKPFILIKFRTMPIGTISAPTHLVESSSISNLGLFLRKTKLDELPQLLNVLKGEMSLVGPRPGLINQIELTDARRRLMVFSVRPGITGLAQINDIDMSTPELLAEIDSLMINDFSLYSYFKYIFITVTGRG